jgi:hypothetical protein
MSDDRLMKELARVAREEGATEDPRARDLLRPFSPAEMDAMVARSAAALGNAQPKQRARRPAFIALAGGLALAAGVALFLTRPPDDVVASTTYDLVIEGAARSSRSSAPSPAGPIEVARDGHLTLVVRPDHPTHAAATAVVMLVHGDDVRAWDVGPQRSDEGAFRIDAGPELLARLPEGASRIAVFVGNPTLVPTTPAEARAVLATPRAGVQTLTVDLVVH